jgi:phosphate transport system substrate-binding protein
VKGPLLQIPETLGGVAIFYNVPGVTVSLNLTGSVLADIYLGNITMWNNPAIAALNPGCHAGSTTCVLPADTITPVHRSDGSGTTYALTNYFEKVSTAWNASFSGGCPCYGTSISWPSSEIGAKGSSGVAAYVNENPNTIGYADSYYALANGLKAAAIQNQAGVFLAPTLTDIAAAANAFSAQVQANPTFTITNAPGAGSYPISTFTYLLVWANQTNQQQGYDTAQLFEWIVNQGQAFGPSLNYPALPANVVAIDQSLIQQIKYNGVPFIQA